MTALFWAAVIIGVAMYVTVVIREMRDWDGPPTHTLDCRDWSTRGVRDPLCLADHPTNHWATPREQVELQDALDGQVGFPKCQRMTTHIPGWTHPLSVDPDDRPAITAANLVAIEAHKTARLASNGDGEEQE